MPQAKTSQAATATPGVAQGKFSVQLAADIGRDLDAIGKVMSDAIFERASVRIDLSRPDVIKSLVATAKEVQREQAEETAASNGTES